MTRLYLKRPGIRPAPVAGLAVRVVGRAAYVRLADIELGGRAEALAAQLRHAAASIEAGPGVVRPGIASEPRVVNLLQVGDIRPDMSDADKLALLLERFRDSPADIYDLLLLDYKSRVGRAYDADAGPSQLEQDLEAVDGLADDLLDDDGALVWGGQSRIAEALGVANAGQANRSRILAVAEALREAA